MALVSLVLVLMPMLLRMFLGRQTTPTPTLYELYAGICTRSAGSNLERSLRVERISGAGKARRPQQARK